jgi:hypothetical protein
MTRQEFLEMQAAAYIDQYEPLPLDLVMQMSAEGMDVVAIEKQLTTERDQNNG